MQNGVSAKATQGHVTNRSFKTNFNKENVTEHGQKEKKDRQKSYKISFVSDGCACKKP
jgi:hypothetical protein